MARDTRRDLLGGLISFGLEVLFVVVLGLLAGAAAWIAIAVVG